MMRFLILVVLIAAPLFTHAQFNAGFIQGIWYSEDSVFAGEPVRIYVALRNNTEYDLSGIVRFTVNGTRVDSHAVSALPGRLVEAWADWTPAYGEHEITATLTDATLHVIGTGPEKIEVVSAIAEDVIVVDYDTDGDGIGNEEDTDDDGDGVSDTEERRAGTDPLVPNESASDPSNTPTPDTSTSEEARAESTVTSAPSREGLERYFSDAGRIAPFLENVTEKVTATKDAIDTYRTNRSERREDTLDLRGKSAQKTRALEGGTATVTRAQIEREQGFIGSIFDSFKALLSGIYTIILWFISGILAYPALIQVFLLIVILTSIYKLAKKMGGRRQF